MFRRDLPPVKSGMPLCHNYTGLFPPDKMQGRKPEYWLEGLPAFPCRGKFPFRKLHGQGDSIGVFYRFLCDRAWSGYFSGKADR